MSPPDIETYGEIDVLTGNGVGYQEVTIFLGGDILAIDKSYYTIITDVGKAKIANASVTGNKVGFVKIQLGDGGGVNISN